MNLKMDFSLYNKNTNLRFFVIYYSTKAFPKNLKMAFSLYNKNTNLRFHLFILFIYLLFSRVWIQTPTAGLIPFKTLAERVFPIVPLVASCDKSATSKECGSLLRSPTIVGR